MRIFSAMRCEQEEHARTGLTPRLLVFVLDLALLPFRLKLPLLFQFTLNPLLAENSLLLKPACYPYICFTWKKTPPTPLQRGELLTAEVFVSLRLLPSRGEVGRGLLSKSVTHILSCLLSLGNRSRRDSGNVERRAFNYWILNNEYWRVPLTSGKKWSAKCFWSLKFDF